MARRPDLERSRAHARPQDRHHRRSDPLPVEERAVGGAHLRPAGRNRIRVFTLCCYEDHVHKNVHIALVKGDLQSSRRPWSACTSRTRCATWSACGAKTSAGRCAPPCSGSRGSRRAWSSSCAPRRAAGVHGQPADARRQTLRRPRRRRHGDTHVRHRRPDPQGSRTQAHARAERAEQLQGLAAFDLEVTELCRWRRIDLRGILRG